MLNLICISCLYKHVDAKQEAFATWLDDQLIVATYAVHKSYTD